MIELTWPMLNLLTIERAYLDRLLRGYRDWCQDGGAELIPVQHAIERARGRMEAALWLIRELDPAKFFDLYGEANLPDQDWLERTMSEQDRRCALGAKLIGLR